MWRLNNKIGMCDTNNATLSLAITQMFYWIISDFWFRLQNGWNYLLGYKIQEKKDFRRVGEFWTCWTWSSHETSKKMRTRIWFVLFTALFPIPLLSPFLTHSRCWMCINWVNKECMNLWNSENFLRWNKRSGSQWYLNS